MGRTVVEQEWRWVRTSLEDHLLGKDVGQVVRVVEGQFRGLLLVNVVGGALSCLLYQEGEVSGLALGFVLGEEDVGATLGVMFCTEVGQEVRALLLVNVVGTLPGHFQLIIVCSLTVSLASWQALTALPLTLLVSSITTI